MMNRYLSDDLLRVPQAFMLVLGLSVIGNGIYVGFNAPIGLFNLPLGMDFYCFWSAGRMTLGGDILSIFDQNAIKIFQQHYLGSTDVAPVWWFYPPLLLLWISCIFALLPYKIAYLAYIGVSVVAYLMLARRVFPAATTLSIMGLPAFWFNLMSGQNGLLFAIIIVGGLVALNKRPIRAGCILALLTFKPQLCLAIPAFLLIERRVQTIAAGVLTAVLLVGLSAALWGIEPWRVFFATLADAQRANHLTGTLRFEYQAHLYGTLRAIGVQHAPAMIANYTFAAVAAGAAIRIWLQPVEPTTKFAVVILMTMLLSPHLTYYDFVVTGAVISWLWPQQNLRPALIILWFAPVMWPVLGKLGIPQLPLAAAMLLYQLSRAVPLGAMQHPAKAME
jgi:alpha-1,2-mannosyltransferase